MAFSSLPEPARLNVGEAIKKWTEDHFEDLTLPYDWRSEVLESLRDGDVKGMRKAALPAAQYKVIQLSQEASSEQIQLQAATLLLAQEGEGAVQRVEHGVMFEQMPPEQLAAYVSSKITRLSQLIPGFSVERLLAGGKLTETTATDVTDDTESSDVLPESGLPDGDK
ncbi:MAG: hypothetical protein HYW38_00605 [Candidatus Colwellbacteria bacterium]|nr:hypothetical protein [Candidatus Colwellbacteria bacterium]